MGYWDGDDPVHSRQEGRFFRGFHDHHCFLPLYVFSGDQLSAACLPPSRIDAASAIKSAHLESRPFHWPRCSSRRRSRQN